MLADSNETNLQLKDAMDVSFKELQLNINSILKSHIIHQKPSLKTVHTETTETIVEVDVHFHQMDAAEKRSCQRLPTSTERQLVSNDVIIIIEDIASDPE